MTELKSSKSTPIAHCDLNAMWQKDLAKYILDLRVYNSIDENNLYLATRVWKERFHEFPTFGVLEVIAGRR